MHMAATRASLVVSLLGLLRPSQCMVWHRAKAGIESFEEHTVVPSSDEVARRLRAINASLDKVAEVIDIANSTSYNMSHQFLEATSSFMEILETLNTAVLAAARVPMGNAAAYVEQADNFISTANSSIANARDKVTSSVGRVSGKLGEVMPKLYDLANKAVANLEEAAEKIQSLSNTTQQPQVNSSQDSAGNHSELSRSLKHKKRHRHATDTTQGQGPLSLMSNSFRLLHRGQDNPCAECSRKNQHANDTLAQLAKEVNEVNETATDFLNAVLGTTTDVLAAFNHSVSSAFQAADAVPDRLLAPVRQDLNQLLAVGAIMSGMVNTQNLRVDRNVADADHTLAAGFILSDALETSVTDACLAGVCGAAAEKRCRDDPAPPRRWRHAALAAICFAVICFVGYYLVSARAE